jgi:hypothetical protein
MMAFSLVFTATTTSTIFSKIGDEKYVSVDYKLNLDFIPLG